MKTIENVTNIYPLLFSEHSIENENFDGLYNSAIKQATEASQLLKSKYNAKSVILFGSLTDKTNFNKQSDIDLAVSGVEDSEFYAAAGYLLKTFYEFKIDLVDINDCNDYIKRSIEREGIVI